MSNRCPFCNSKDLFEQFEITNIMSRMGDINQINQEYTLCMDCNQEFVSPQQARNNDSKYFNN